jgi:translation initiation factor IF-1
MPINFKGGNKTKKQKKNCHKYEITNKLSENQMFAKVIKNQGNHFILLCSDNIQRISPLTGTVRRKCPRLTKDSFVIIETTDQKYCNIISLGDPPSNILDVFKHNDPKQVNDFDFDYGDNEFADLIEKQNTSNFENNSDEHDLLQITENNDLLIHGKNINHNSDEDNFNLDDL